MVDFKDFCESLIPKKTRADSLKLNYLSDIDLDVCSYVISQLLPYESYDEEFHLGRILSFKEFVELSLNEVKLFGDEIYSKVKDLVSVVPIDRCVGNFLRFATTVNYSTDYKTQFDVANLGIISRFIVPENLYEYCIYGIAHEYIHGLKENNYEEYKNVFVLGEIIPIFFELLMFNPNDVLRKQLINERISSLVYGDTEGFLLADELVKNDCENNINIKCNDDFYQQRSLYEFVRSESGCYLNSFYYAIILYGMYKETPKKILDLVSKVLKHEITTLDMLMQLGIYGDIRGEFFEKEFRYLKRTLI